ncbi:MAG: LLM class flavin-dependent oxidoreductase [Chloroflexi bacterium]|nr:LLM class flavin-dependent oxidoreductase [Chloroflexota bacterium]
MTDASAGGGEAGEVGEAGEAGGRIGFKTSPQGVDWATLDATWALAGELDVFDAAWMNDHFTDPRRDHGGASFESLTLAAALAHRVPGKWIGHGVLANTFRHPALLAKAATVLDHVTGGRFIVGLGAGWHEREHRDYGIALPPIGERIGRLESAVDVLKALFSAEAALPPGVTRPDPFYPLDGALNEPPPRRPGGPPIWLGGQKRRGLALAARAADGWIMPGDRAGDVEYLRGKRDEMLRAIEAAGRDPGGFAFAGQVSVGADAAGHRAAVETARAFVAAGADHIVLGMPAVGGPDALRTMAEEVAAPLRDGWS